MKLPYGQDELIRKIVEANPKTVVVLEGTIVEMGVWLEKTPVLLEAWYPGMEGGSALAAILFGDVNPSGKLPCTFPKGLSDSPAHAEGAPGDYPEADGTVTYAEGLLVGYRWFDTKGIEPQFPFGHGLSYTTFEFSNLKLAPGHDPSKPSLTVTFDVRNTGARPGGEVAQLYVRPKEPRLSRPDKELKGFRKIFLEPGETRAVSIPLEAEAFAFYDPTQGQWVAEKGGFEILVGKSSIDLPLHAPFNLSHTVAFR